MALALLPGSDRTKVRYDCWLRPPAETITPPAPTHKLEAEIVMEEACEIRVPVTDNAPPSKVNATLAAVKVTEAPGAIVRDDAVSVEADTE